MSSSVFRVCCSCTSDANVCDHIPGGKHFSRDLQPLDAEGNQVSMWSPDAKNKDEEDNEEESEEESSEEDEENKADDNGELSREDRKSLKKARKDAAIAKQSARTVEVGDMPTSDEESDEDLPANPNHTKAARSLTRVNDGVDDITEGVKKLPASRKEREAVEAAAAKERYLKLQSQGKTDEAKADLERLKAIREQRASEAARRQVSGWPLPFPPLHLEYSHFT